MRKKVLIVNNCVRYNDFFNNYDIFALEDFEKITPDIIIVDDKNRLILNSYNITNIPVILLFEHDILRKELEELNYKIEVFLMLPILYEELEMKIEELVALKDLESEKLQLKLSNAKLHNTLNQLKQTQQKFMQSINSNSCFESESGVYNKKYLINHLQKEFDRTRRHNRNFAIVVIEVENLNSIKEVYGQLIEENIVNRISRITLEMLRSSDIVGFFRENIFMLILPEIIEKYTLIVIERILSKLNNIKIQNIDLKINTGFSIVNQERCQFFKDVNALLAVMEKLLFFSKESNQAIVEFKEENIESIDKIRAVIDENDLQEKHDLIWDELQKSREFIEKLLPKKDSWKSKVNYSYMYYPFNFIGGDFFDFEEIDKDRVAVIFCDVSGHGVSSALYITAIKFIFKSIIQKDNKINPKEFMEFFNKNISDISQGNIFVATTYGILNKKDKTFSYSFGGGTSPLKISTKSKQIENLDNEGFVVGLMEDAYFEENIINLSDDDIILFYSDGIYEFLIEYGLMSDEQEFYKLIENNIVPDETDLLSKLYRLMQSKIDGNVDFNDDITLLALTL